MGFKLPGRKGKWNQHNMWFQPPLWLHIYVFLYKIFPDEVRICATISSAAPGSSINVFWAHTAGDAWWDLDVLI